MQAKLTIHGNDADKAAAALAKWGPMMGLTVSTFDVRKGIDSRTVDAWKASPGVAILLVNDAKVLGVK